MMGARASGFSILVGTVGSLATGLGVSQVKRLEFDIHQRLGSVSSFVKLTCYAIRTMRLGRVYSINFKVL